MKTKFKATSFKNKFKVIDNHHVMWAKVKSKKEAEMIANELNKTEKNRDYFAQQTYVKDYDKLTMSEAQHVNSLMKQAGYKLPIDYVIATNVTPDDVYDNAGDKQ